MNLSIDNNGNLPLVSICIPLYNKSQYIERTLKMALAQTYPHLEVIVNDNGSTDGSDLIVKQYQAVDPRIKYHRLEHTIHIAENWRYTLLLAKGDYLHLLSADDCITPDFVREMMLPILNNRQIDFTCCNLQPLFEGEIDVKFVQEVESYFSQVNKFNQGLLKLSDKNKKLEYIGTVCSYANYFGSTIGVLFNRSCLPIKDWDSAFASLGCNTHPDWNFLIRLHSNHCGYFVEENLAQFSYNYSGTALEQNKSFQRQSQTAGGDFQIPFITLADPALSKVRENMSSDLIYKVKQIAQYNLEKSYEVAADFDRHVRSNLTTDVIRSEAKHILLYTQVENNIY